MEKFQFPTMQIPDPALFLLSHLDSLNLFCFSHYFSSFRVSFRSIFQWPWIRMQRHEMGRESEWTVRIRKGNRNRDRVRGRTLDHCLIWVGLGERISIEREVQRRKGWFMQSLHSSSFSSFYSSSTSILNFIVLICIIENIDFPGD